MKTGIETDDVYCEYSFDLNQCIRIIVMIAVEEVLPAKSVSVSKKKHDGKLWTHTFNFLIKFQT